ncbi:alpha/beta fold hydrolase [Methylobacterium sp. 17Sr1-1]|uniref:alpha/beta fold hydrolase n=1 Tax=Methylobacterium sp. 17Sr1-1 TaxID=2202826 RepID=UPI000D6F482E|nr:alpha/beta fold hydrolase [Methylobacterium sp. 17Sr1-1]AWN52811.1 thioesterase [Methylobacterium sp. 17Sr1-1]
MLTDGAREGPISGPILGPAAESLAAEPVPVVLGDAFGWFSPGARRRGVLLCGTFGFEQWCAYRSWRELAAMIAGTGCPTLRFDYPGQGDSRDPAGPEIPAALDAIRAGIAYLRERAGAEEVVVVGLRLGATLAALSGGDIDRLVMLAPFSTGKAYRREMAMQSRLIDVMPDRTPMPQEPDSLMVGSFLLGPRTLADLARLDLAASKRAPAPQILMLGPKIETLAERYRALGSDVETGPLPDLTQLVSDPLFPRLPAETFARVRDFAVAQAPAPAASSPVPASIPSPAPCRLADAAWQEEVSRFGPGLVGILCRPRGAWGGGTVLVVNSGRNPRAGHGRQTTQLARRLAASGIASFRFDLRGVGDSAERPDGAPPLYTVDAVEDVQAALNHLEARQHTPCVVLGVCSGAFLAFQTICRDERLSAAVLVNLYCFDVAPGTDVETMIRDSFRGEVSYAERARQGALWRRIVSGELPVGRILRAVGRDARARLAAWTARIPGLAPGGVTVARRVARLRRRGARIHAVYSRGDRGIAALAANLGQSPEGIARKLGYPVTVLDDVDHNLSRPADQERLFAIVRDAVEDARRARSAEPEAGLAARPRDVPDPSGSRPAPVAAVRA